MRAADEKLIINKLGPNVSILAAVPCGQSATFVTLNYSESPVKIIVILAIFNTQLIVPTAHSFKVMIP